MLDSIDAQQRAAERSLRSTLTSRLPRTERGLRVFTAGLFWLVTTAFFLGASFVPAVAPDDVNFWRLVLGVPATVFTAFHFVVMPRMRDRTRDVWLVISALAAAGANLVLLHVTNATWAVEISLMTSVIWAAYFLQARVVVWIVAVVTTVAISPLLTTDGILEQPGDGARLAMYVPALWALVVALHVQKRTIDRAYARSNVLAYRDPLTGLANRRALRERFARATSEHGATRNLTLLLIDIDNFKNANTQFGHAGGDLALCEVAHQFKRLSAANHLVTRIGGDEFAVLLIGESSERSKLHAAMYRRAVVAANPQIELDDVEFDASVGLAQYPDDGTTLEELLTVADRSMYREKAKRAPETVARASARDTDLNGSVTRDGSVDSPSAPAAHDPSAQSRWTRLSVKWFERTLFARAIALYWIASSIMIAITQLMPGVSDDFVWLTLLCCLLGVTLGPGLLVANVKAGGPTHCILDALSISGLVGVIYLTGGAQSPAAPLLPIYGLYQAWFWGTRAIPLRLTVMAIAIAFPVIYDPVFSAPNWELSAIFMLATMALTSMLIAVLAVNTSVLRRVQVHASALAMIDPLTDLPNRRAFADRFEDELAAMPTSGKQMALVMLDLDNFKAINTQLGHGAGDELLHKIGHSIAGAMRQDDMVARIGGDEFAAILPGAGVEGGRSGAERLVAAVAVATAEIAARHQIVVTASAGFALFPLHGDDLDQLMQAADTALRSIKQQGKNGVSVSELVVGLQ